MLDLKVLIRPLSTLTQVVRLSPEGIKLHLFLQPPRREERHALRDADVEDVPADRIRNTTRYSDACKSRLRSTAEYFRCKEIKTWVFDFPPVVLMEVWGGLAKCLREECSRIELRIDRCEFK